MRKRAWLLLIAGIMGTGFAVGQTGRTPAGPVNPQHALCDKDGDGICDFTGLPVGQGRGPMAGRGMGQGRRSGQGAGMGMGPGMGYGRGMGRGGLMGAPGVMQPRPRIPPTRSNAAGRYPAAAATLSMARRFPHRPRHLVHLRIADRLEHFGGVHHSH